MGSFFLILRYRALGGARWLKQHAFVSFVLAPMIVGGSLAVLWDAIVAGLTSVDSSTVGVDSYVVFGLGIAALLVALHFGAAIRLTFGLGAGDRALDAQPVPRGARFNADLVTLAVMNLPAVAAIAALAVGMTMLRADASENGVPFPNPAELALRMAGHAPLLVLQLAGLEMIAVMACVLARVHSGWRLLIPGGLIAALVALRAATPWAGIAVGPLFAPAYIVCVWFSEGGDHSWFPASLLSQTLFAGANLIVAAMLYAVAFRASLQFRTPLRPRVVEADAAAVPAIVPFARMLARRWGLSLVAQVRRDWRLTLRGFSPAAGFCMAAAALPHLGAWAYFSRYGADAKTVHVAAQTASALSSAALAAVVMFLLAYELRYFWPEKTAASSLDTIWQSKVLFALLVAAPAALAAALWGALLHPGSPSERALTALAALAIGPFVASFMGMLSFEVANRPGLGVLLSALVAVGGAVITAIKPAFWLLLLFAYGQGMHALSLRAKERVRFTEIER